MSQSIATPQAITAAEAYRRADLSALTFTTTADLEPLTTMVGQERAVQALHMGLGIPQQGYNIFVSWLAGGRAPKSKRYCEREPPPYPPLAIGYMSTISVHPINRRPWRWSLDRGS